VIGDREFIEGLPTAACSLRTPPRGASAVGGRGVGPLGASTTTTMASTLHVLFVSHVVGFGAIFSPNTNEWPMAMLVFYIHTCFCFECCTGTLK